MNILLHICGVGTIFRVDVRTPSNRYTLYKHKYDDYINNYASNVVLHVIYVFLYVLNYI